MPLSPVPASRPRVTRWGTYHLKRYSTWMKQVALHLPVGDEPVFTGPVAVYCEFVVRKPKTTKLSMPRADNDNLEKATYDAITKCMCVWKDDNQIQMNLSVKRFTNPKEEPHTEVHIVPL